MGRFVVLLSGIFAVFSAYATTCRENQYLSDGVCVNCIYNATCDGNNYVCQDGFYDNGENECVACPVNSICAGPTEFTCRPGSYLADGGCNLCPGNATCDGGDAPFLCNDGWFRYKQECVSCKGHVCDGDVLQSCGAGYVRYPFGDNLIVHGQYCLQCAPRYYCPAGTTRYICETGWYENSNGGCTQCQPEYYCPRGTTSMFDYCAAGYYRTGNSCSKCDDGIECPGGDVIECSAGLIAHSNGQCLPYAENDPGVSGDCHVGYYDTGVQCLPCPDNSICAGPDDFQCRAGFYKNGDACDMCPENSACGQSSTQITCVPGYWRNGTRCDECGANSYCHDSIKYACPAFDADNYKFQEDDAVLVSYTKPYSTAKPTASDIKDCVVGYITVKTSQGEYSIRWAPWSDARGQYDGGKKFWHSAAVGYYLSDATAINNEIEYQSIYPCTNAPEYATYTGVGAPGGNDCAWQCDDGYMRDGDICTTCPAGYVCVDGILICPPGQYANGMECMTCPEFYDARSVENTAPQSINECQIKCDVGTYVAAPTATECTNVGSGYWATENYTNYGAVGIRNRCPDNMTTIGFGRGADSADDCGKVMHIGNYVLYLRSVKLTSPSLVVRYGNRLLYGSMTTERRGHLRAEYAGRVYSVFNSDID